MDTYEATKIVMSRIKAIDPDNASKIMGYILIQDQGEKEIIRLAFGPPSTLISQINQAKSFLPLNTSPTIRIPNPTPISYASLLNNNGSASNVDDDEFFSTDMDPVLSPVHRRSCSVNESSFLSNLDEFNTNNNNGFVGWRPCMYFARGFCKNGSFCKFSHCEFNEGVEMARGKSVASSFDEVLRIKALQQRFGLMGNGNYNVNPFLFGKCGNFMNENLRDEFLHMGLGGYGSSTSRQIYLTFPADSTFKEEDVSGYFNMFGPVQDVRIPYQQKRMFGFVTFLYPETVKLILAKGNPHFVCDSRVLVKPYKEKGRIPERKFQHSDSGEYSACLSPDSREHFDLPFGSRMLFNTQEMMLRRKLEQDAELQQAIELQERRMLNLQLLDLKNQHHDFLPGPPPGLPIFSPRQSQFLMNQNVNRAGPEEFDGHKKAAKSQCNAAAGKNVITEVTDSSYKNIGSGNQELLNGDVSVLPESLEHIFPDNLLASPTKKSSTSEQHSTFSQAFSSDNGNMLGTTTSSNNKTSLLKDSSPLNIHTLSQTSLLSDAKPLKCRWWS